MRGLICYSCNVVVVRFIEDYPTRRLPSEQAYLDDRPMLRYRAEETAACVRDGA